MKFLPILLVFAVFTASQAFVIREEDPDSRLVQLNKQLKELLNDLTRKLNEKVDLIMNLELSQQLLNRVHVGFSKVGHRLQSLEAELPAEMKEAFKGVVGVPWDLGKKALVTLTALEEKVRPVSQELTDKLSSILTPYADSVLDRVGPYTETLRRALATARTEGLNPKLVEKLKQQLEELRTQLSPYVQKLQDQLQELQANLVEPITDKAQEKFKQGVEKVNQGLEPYVARILKNLREYAKYFKKWLNTPSIFSTH